MTNYISMPDALPAKPTGWKKSMVAHLNCGPKGHIGSYEVFDEKGEKTVIGWQYHTKDTTATGFFLPGIEPCMTWDELRRIWPIWIERARRKQREAQETRAK